MNTERGITHLLARRWRAIVGLLWVGFVVVAYYVFNWPYYAEKITVFGRFLFG